MLDGYGKRRVFIRVPSSSFDHRYSLEATKGPDVLCNRTETGSPVNGKSCRRVSTELNDSPPADSVRVTFRNPSDPRPWTLPRNSSYRKLEMTCPPSPLPSVVRSLDTTSSFVWRCGSGQPAVLPAACTASSVRGRYVNSAPTPSPSATEVSKSGTCPLRKRTRT